MPLALPKTV